ncbi:MAG: hypothetical protein V1841_01000 [Patescibacteria group bacterium]
MPFFTYYFTNPLDKPIFILLAQVLIVGGFGLAAYFIIRYLKTFYKGRPVPKEWNYFWLAMIWGTIHELIEMGMLYQVIGGQLALIAFFFAQVIAGIYLILGTYLLAKRYIAK